MATRRNVPTFDEKAPTSSTSSSADRILTPLQQAADATVNTPAVPARVVYKLLFFTFAMVVAPIGMYFLTVNNVYSGNTTWAGATAAVTANVVLIGYILAAVWEDQGEEGERAAAAVGKMKGRTGKVE